MIHGIMIHGFMTRDVMNYVIIHGVMIHGVMPYDHDGELHGNEHTVHIRPSVFSMSCDSRRVPCEPINES